MDTRVTMLFSFVLGCLFVSTLECVKLLPEDRDALMEVALGIQNFDTGYPCEPYTENVIKNSEVDSLKGIIKAKVDQLYCRYMTSLVDHMDSTRALFHHRMGDEQIECIASFKDVAQEMIGTLYGLGDREFDGLWLFLVYVDELPKYFKSVTTLSVELADKLANVHKAVTRYLTYETYQRQCADHKRTSSESQSVDFVANLNAIKTLMANNRQHGVFADNSNNNSFTPAQLYLNDFVVDEQLVAGLQLLVSDLQIEWNAFYVQLTELNAKAHDFLLLGHGPRSIDAYQDLLLEFVELVIVRFARKHIFLIVYDRDRQMLMNWFSDLSSLYGVDNATMSVQTEAMMRLFRIDNQWLNKCILMLQKPITIDNWNAMETAGRQEERRIIAKHNRLINATRVEPNSSVVLDKFQSVLKLASSRGITLTDQTPDLEKNVITPVRMNIITMDVTYKYFANVLFKDVDFGLLDLFRRRKK